MPTVLITGVGRAGQLGDAVASTFAERGWSIIAVGHSLAEPEARAAELRARGRDARALACDLTDTSQLSALVTDVTRLSDGRLDALVNLAGGFAVSGPVADSEPAVWARMFSLNATSAYLATRALLPLLRAARGAIVYVASSAALPAASVANVSAYAMSKVAVLTLMRAVAAEERDVVRANAVAPISIRTAANESAMGSDARYVEREEVADAILYLCSGESRAVTGQVIALE